MIGFDREAAEYIISALKEDGEELDYSLMERVIFLAFEGELAYLEKEGMLKDGELFEGEYDEDDAFEALFAEMTDGLEDDGEIGRIAQMLDAYMEARQDFMEENGLADD